jgi:hypothetical protein
VYCDERLDRARCGISTTAQDSIERAKAFSRMEVTCSAQRGNQG